MAVLEQQRTAYRSVFETISTFSGQVLYPFVPPHTITASFPTDDGAGETVGVTVGASVLARSDTQTCLLSCPQPDPRVQSSK
eukprot:CAMPEP_0197234458 /NCGR_PEP_ID=MMETSP1429-20130617/2210_1 /TAXON_ID=49237 /ORGANISM="Chaetoceros  sp., Strain UNC1202" /LENGTH=81 /DNA_ID=CAMNT_0042692873 /DNA_START=149 /DNA_END=391 /DNA_ORIENTATION=+